MIDIEKITPEQLDDELKLESCPDDIYNDDYIQPLPPVMLESCNMTVGSISVSCGNVLLAAQIANVMYSLTCNELDHHEADRWLEDMKKENKQ